MSDHEIDTALLSAVGEHWTKAGLTVARTADLLGERYRNVAARMKTLIEQGILTWEGGDISDGRSWVMAKVRKSN